MEGQEADDEAMFEKRYKEYIQENKIVREYRERMLLVEVDTAYVRGIRLPISGTF